MLKAFSQVLTLRSDQVLCKDKTLASLEILSHLSFLIPFLLLNNFLPRQQKAKTNKQMLDRDLVVFRFPCFFVRCFVVASFPSPPLLL